MTSHAAPPPAQRKDGWSHLALITPSAGYFAFFAVAASLVLPFEGIGVDLCALHSVTGLPCPGCGLTRSFVMVAQGDFATAVASNPFVLFLYPLFLVLGALVVMPAGIRDQVERWLRVHSSLVGRLYRVGVIAFLGFGGLRFTYFLFSGERFP